MMAPIRSLAMVGSRTRSWAIACRSSSSTVSCWSRCLHSASFPCCRVCGYSTSRAVSRFCVYLPNEFGGFETCRTPLEGGGGERPGRA
jgi:hypothetical protein